MFPQGTLSAQKELTKLENFLFAEAAGQQILIMLQAILDFHPEDGRHVGGDQGKALSIAREGLFLHISRPQKMTDGTGNGGAIQP